MGLRVLQSYNHCVCIFAYIYTYIFVYNTEGLWEGMFKMSSNRLSTSSIEKYCGEAFISS